MQNCQKMAQNAIKLASQAMRILNVSGWSPQDCAEFLENMEEEFRKALDTYSPQECDADAAVKKRIS